MKYDSIKSILKGKPIELFSIIVYIPTKHGIHLIKNLDNGKFVKVANLTSKQCTKLVELGYKKNIIEI